MDKKILTPREIEVLDWIKNGKTSFEIGKILNIAENTVEIHVGKIMKKLSASTRSQAVGIGIIDGLLS